MCQLNGIRCAAGGAGGTCRPVRNPRTAMPTVVAAAIVRRGRKHARENCPAEDGEIGASLHQAGAAEHFVLAQMLRQDGVFDRPEEGRVHAHGEDRREHQELACEHDSGAAEDHDANFRELDDPDDARLVMIVGKLSGQGRKQEEGQNEQALRDRAEEELLPRVLKQLVGDEQHHRLLEQAVVERAQELGREQRQEPPRAQQVGDVLDQARAAGGFMGADRGHSQLSRRRQTL